jgi:hypothetical protein
METLQSVNQFGKYTVEELRRRLGRYSGTHAESEDIARWAGAGYLCFMEEAESENGESEFLCDILGDIEAQWEMLTANAFDQGGKEAADYISFPENYISEWISQIDEFVGKSDMQTELILRIDRHLSWNQNSQMRYFCNSNMSL